MTNNTQQIPATDVHSYFLEDISLWNLIGNEKAVNQLKIAVNQYHTDKAEGRLPATVPIIVKGIEGSGRTVFSHAYSNGLGCDKCIIAEGSTLSMGGQGIVEFLQLGTEYSSYLITNAEKLSPYCCHIISSVLNHGILIIPKIRGIREASTLIWKRLVMFSTTDTTQVNPELLKITDLKLYLNDYSTEEIFKILKQRIQYLGWKVENTNLLQNIAEISFETVSIAINILSWTYRCCRSSGEDVMTAKHVNQALHLMKDDKS